MNRLVSAVAISFITVSSLAGVAHAKMWAGADIHQSNLDNAVKALRGKNFIVVDTGTLDKSDAMSNPMTYADNVKSLQKAISENKHLQAELKAQAVEIRNIVAVDEAADGNFIFYVK